MTQTDAAHYVANPHRGAWRPMRDVGEETILAVLRRVERVFPWWSGTVIASRGRVQRGSVHDAVAQFLEGKS
jgi:hypothetical protein